MNLLGKIASQLDDDLRHPSYIAACIVVVMLALLVCGLMLWGSAFLILWLFGLV